MFDPKSTLCQRNKFQQQARPSIETVTHVSMAEFQKGEGLHEGYLFTSSELEQGHSTKNDLPLTQMYFP